MLINCSECGNQVSDKATACPHCGAPIQEEKVTTDWLGRVIICPYCGSKNTKVGFVSGIDPKKTKVKTTLNLNPLHPFTLTNSKTVEKRRSGSGKQCNDCGKVWDVV